MAYPTNDVRLITKAAVQAIDHLFQPGYWYGKADVLLMDLRQPGEITDDLFAELQPVATNKLMGVLDEINGRWGRGTMRTAAMPADPNWAMCRKLMCQSYTTHLDQLWTFKAN
jgi:DNA polymerase V